MNLDDVAAELRRRKGAEAMDLGLLLGRRFYGAILLPWLVLIPLLVVVKFAAGWLVAPWAAVFAGWWLKPLFDRVTLHVVSRRFFGSSPSTKQTVGAVTDQWLTLDALADLTWRRFSPVRSMTMPVRVLENADRKEARRRIGDLYDASSHTLGIGLSSMALAFKGLFYLSAAILVVMVVPAETVVDPLAPLEFLFQDADSWVLIAVIVATTTIATTLVEPFYAAGGFGIYIQRRIEREGWDLELRFRRLAERLRRGLDGTTACLLAAGFAVIAAFGTAPPQAQAHGTDDAPYTEADPSSHITPNPDVVPVDDPQKILEELLDDEPFSPKPYTETQWVRTEEPEDDESTWLDDLFEWIEDREWPEWLQGSGVIVAHILRILAWIIAMAAVAFVVWKIFNRVRLDPPQKATRRSRWQQQLVEDAGPDLTIPAGESPGQHIRLRWQRGEHRQALAILLVESLVEFESRYDFDFPVGWTISRCGREVSDIHPEGAVLNEAAKLFSQLAWAGKRPTDRQFEQLVTRWESAFSDRGDDRE